MKRILIPANGLSSWKGLLKEEDHWKRGRSAFETAVSWERGARTARGIPEEVAGILDQVSALRGCHLLLAVPEHKVHLKSRGNPSQNDVWTLMRAGDDLVSMAVEGKAGESFDKTLEDWMADGRPVSGKEERLKNLCEVVGMAEPVDRSLRYQLFHRLASAILEAQRFRARHAVMMVQSFAPDPQSWGDFQRFMQALHAEVTEGRICKVSQQGAISLYVGWASCKCATDAQIAEIS